MAVLGALPNAITRWGIVLAFAAAALLAIEPEQTVPDQKVHEPRS